MSMLLPPIMVPETETAPYVRPLVKSSKLERGTVSSDPGLMGAEEFLRGLDADYAPAVVEQTITLLRRLRARFSDLGIPTISPGPDGIVGMTWEDTRHHVNLQVHPDHRLEFFAEDLQTGALWSDEAAWNVLGEGLFEHLQRVGEG